MSIQRIKWTSDFSTGIPEIDRQHKAIIDYSMQYRDVLENGAGKETYDGFLEFIGAYVSIHFDYEENCMFVHQCPIAGKNKAAHAVFIKLLEAEVAEFEQSGYDEIRVKTFLDKMDNWLFSHIGQIDVKLRDVVESGSGTPD